MTCGNDDSRIAAGYVRNSTLPQVGNAREDVQRETVERLARQHGFDRFELFEDLGISGEEVANRPGYMRMLGKIEKNLVGAVFTLELSRLSRDRDFIDGFTLYGICRAHNTVIVTPEKTYDPNNSADQLLLAVGLWGSSMQKRLNVGAMAQGTLKSAEQGNLWNGHTPLGYGREPMPGVLSSKRKTWLKKDEVEAHLVELVYSLVERMGVRKTAEYLNAHGHRYPVKSLKRQITLGQRHNNGIPMTERPWYTSDVLRVVHNRLYAGWYVWGVRRDSEYYKDVTQPVELRMGRLQIIPELRWQAVQNLLASRNPAVTPPRSTTSRYLFSGLIKCAKCGGSMKGAHTRTSDPARRQRLYRCVNHAEAGGCPGDTVREVIVRKAVRHDLGSVIAAMGIMKVLEQAVADTVGSRRSRMAVESLDAELARLEEARVKALNLHYAARLDETEVAAELERIVALRKQAIRKKEVEQSRQRHQITADELREFMGNDLSTWIKELQGARLSKVAKLVYQSFVLEAEGASHRRRGRLSEVRYREDVLALLPKRHSNRSKGGAIGQTHGQNVRFGTGSVH